ncbi:inactive ribonuclease-like protein 9 [Tamandua tetradactyla]|uniref:inactive ribonuclease-like protein 9 n=1 Tax=Tamandua tetradactyla TaxID=48850 RepID=UPI004053BDB9
MTVEEFEYSETFKEYIEDYLNEFHAVGPTREPTKEKFIKKVILKPGRPLTDPDYCNDEVRNKNVHKHLHCVQEHYFLQTKYEDIQKLCYNLFVNCKNGIKRCNRSNKLIDGLYCKLISGTQIPMCDYESVYKKGYVFITCKWQNEIQELVPVTINDIMV